MSPALAPLDVATHWPYVREQLHLERRTAADRALHLLAEAQVDSVGAPARLGIARVRQRGLTRGEAGNVWRALRDLEGRRVVVCYPGSGPRPHAWSFQPDLENWRGMPWRISGRDVERRILGCICRAVVVTVARIPGQSVAHMENSPEFGILSRVGHLRPGLFPVDSRDCDGGRATVTTGQAQEPVETRDYFGPNRAPVNSSIELIVLNAEEQFRMQRLKEATEHRCQQELRTGSAPWKVIAKLCRRLTDDQIEALVRALSREPGHMYFPKVANVLEDLSVEREVKLAGRPAHLDEFDFQEA